MTEAGIRRLPAEVAAKMGSWRHGYALTNGIQLHYVTQGEGELAILLHGFPEFWYSWRHQIPVLAQRFCVVAPDLRGYNDSDKPDHGYDLDTLTADVRGLLDHFGAKRAVVVAHDWGGAIAWHWAQFFPDEIRKLAVLNSPHPACFRREFLTNLDQVLAEIEGTAEGVYTAPVVVKIAAQHNIRVPITQEVHRLLQGQTTPTAALARLMERQLTSE